MSSDAKLPGLRMSDRFTRHGVSEGTDEAELPTAGLIERLADNHREFLGF